MFFPGETISHKFTLPFVRSDITKVYITYRQDGRVFLVKSVIGTQISRIKDSPEMFFVLSFSQDESLLFDVNNEFTAQLNVIFNDGKRATSKEMKGTNGLQHIQEVVT